MNTKDLSEIMIVIGIKLLNTDGKQITTLTGIRRKLLRWKEGYFKEDHRNSTFFEES